MISDAGYDLGFAYAYGGPLGQCRIKQNPSDFVVSEMPSYQPSGDGEHVLLQIRKENQNTDWVARELARFAGISRRDVGYAGRKDRRAITTQWFSCRMAGRSPPDWHEFNSADVSVLAWHRHHRKLKPGALKGNSFELILRDIDPSITTALENRLQEIKRNGVPNYFGPQRFGRGGNNLAMAEKLLTGKLPRRCRDRDLYLSAARSWIFNRVLSDQVMSGRWGERKPDGGSQIGSLFGMGEFDADQDRACRELAPGWCDALVAMKMKRSYRALSLDAEELTWDFISASDLKLQFGLPRGCYATVLIRELFESEFEWAESVDDD